jgi:hypothetical protein
MSDLRTTHNLLNWFTPVLKSTMLAAMTIALSVKPSRTAAGYNWSGGHSVENLHLLSTIGRISKDIPGSRGADRDPGLLWHSVANGVSCRYQDETIFRPIEKQSGRVQ